MRTGTNNWTLPAVHMAALLLLATGSGLADGKGHGYRGGDPRYFDPESIVTLGGVLTEATGNWAPRGHGNHTGGGMSFRFEADSREIFEIMLAPDWFLEEAGISLTPGEQITVTGSVVDKYDNGDHHVGGDSHEVGHRGGGMMGDDEHPYLIATRLAVDGLTLTVRDDEGYPAWRGGPDWMGHQWFDPDADATMTGTLGDLLGMWSATGQGNHTGNGMHYVFESSSGESYYAMLGPWWFMKGQGVAMKSGKEIEIRGSVVAPYWANHADRRFFVAREVHVGEKTIQLRDHWGYPLWHGTGWHYSSPDWLPGNMHTITGDVVKVRRKTHGRFLDKGYEVVIRSEGQLLAVFVAPNWDVNHLGLKLKRGNRISVRGSQSREPGQDHLVVQYLDFEGERWHFRGRKGAPRWVHGAK